MVRNRDQFNSLSTRSLGTGGESDSAADIDSLIEGLDVILFRLWEQVLQLILTEVAEDGKNWETLGTERTETPFSNLLHEEFTGQVAGLAIFGGFAHGEVGAGGEAGGLQGSVTFHRGGSKRGHA